MEQQAIITVKDLRTYFYSDKRCNKVLNGVSFELYKGRTLCVVGESGCGKSVTASSIMQLLPKLSRIESGAITYHSEKGDIRSAPPSAATSSPRSSTPTTVRRWPPSAKASCAANMPPSRVPAR